MNVITSIAAADTAPPNLMAQYGPTLIANGYHILPFDHLRRNPVIFAKVSGIPISDGRGTALDQPARLSWKYGQLGLAARLASRAGSLPRLTSMYWMQISHSGSKR